MATPSDFNRAVLVRSGPVPRDVKRAIDYMRRNMGRKIAVPDLAAVCDVAERTLREHFRQFFGLSPLAFFRRLRLAAVRESLLDGANCTTITEVATRYGFSHFGRFSQPNLRRSPVVHLRSRPCNRRGPDDGPNWR